MPTFAMQTFSRPLAALLAATCSLLTTACADLPVPPAKRVQTEVWLFKSQVPANPWNWTGDSMDALDASAMSKEDRNWAMAFIVNASLEARLARMAVEGPRALECRWSRVLKVQARTERPIEVRDVNNMKSTHAPQSFAETWDVESCGTVQRWLFLDVLTPKGVDTRAFKFQGAH